MDLSRLRSVLEHPGPVATVYLESRPPGEDAGQQSRLRWQAVRETLHDAGATAAALDAIGSELQRDPVGEIQVDGRILVAGADGDVLLDAQWDAALGSGDFGFWADTAELEPYVREALTSVRVLVAVAGQQGARVRQEVVAEHQEIADVVSTAVDGSSRASVHKPREGYMSHKQNQRRADEAVQQNARDIAAHLTHVAGGFRPDALVLAGPVQGRTAVREELPEHLSRICVETDRGGTQDETAEAALAEQIDEIAAAIRDRRISEDTDAFAQAKGHGLTVEGADAVAEAARMGAVSTLVLPRGSAARSSVGSALAASSSCGADAALAQIRSDGAEVGSEGPSVAAILRFAVPTT